MARNRRRRRGQGARGGDQPEQRPGSPTTPRQTATARREGQRQARRSAARREDRRVWLYVGGGGAALIALIVVLIVINLGGTSGPGQRIPNLGRQHLEFGQTFTDYNSDPPTSGKHSPSPMPSGSYSNGAPDERLVHSLEHAYVVINHNCDASQCPELINQLDRLVVRYDSKVILNYRPQTASRIALTAWTRLDTMEEFDEDRIVDFIDSYRGKIGPEPNAP